MSVPAAGPFYLALVDGSETTFGPEHLRMDLYVFSVKRTLSEGQKPMLELEIENPRVGLLSLPKWAWFAWDNGTETVSLFFGRLVGNPVQLFSETITIQFIADPKNYKHQVQMLAEEMKTLPYWAPEWIEAGKRDDPDKILETRAAFWDVHPVTHEVLAVGITEGPDGNVDLDESSHFYDGMSTTVGQPPATAILMDATANWTQTAHGLVDIGNHTVKSYSGSLASDWPKPLTQLGGGYSVFASDAYDTGRADIAESVTVSYSWQNKEKHHSNGDTMSISFSQTMPIGPVGQEKILTESSQTGIIDPFAVDEDGDPSPLNLPASFNQTSMAALTYTVSTSMILEYRAERQRTERVVFTVRADMQPILVDPDVDQESEVITLNSANVGVPILNLLNWTTISGTHVEVGQVVFPDDPQTPGGRTAQIAVTEGDAGTEPPDFSDVPSEETVDGTVTWSSLGVAAPPENAADWTFGTHYNKGEIILPRRPFYVQYSVLVAGGHHQFPPKGTSVHEGLIVQAPNGSFQVVVEAGTTTPNATPSFSATWGAITMDGEITWKSLGTQLPSGTTYFIAVEDGTSGAQYVTPPFGVHQTLHDRVTDGGVTWQSIGTGEIPIGGVLGDIRAPSFFTIDRGMRSLEYLALLVRAKLLWRARCVDVEFDVDWATGHAITTRNTVTLHDPRLAGGLVLGKVKSATLSFGDSGSATCRVVIGCTVGRDNAVEQVDGDPVYADDDYCDSDYQEHEGVVVLLPTGSDLTYEPPAYRVVDDGLVFPLTREQVVLVDEVRGSFAAQSAAVSSALDSMAEAARTFPQPPGGFDAVYSAQLKKKLLLANSVQQATENFPVWIEYQFKPVNAGPFHSVIRPRFSDFTLGRGIDLESEVTT